MIRRFFGAAAASFFCCVSAAAQPLVFDPPVLAKKNGGDQCFSGDRDVDAATDRPQPIVRTAPDIPRKCLRRLAATEVVSVLFDVGADGAACNIRIVSTTNRCLSEAAAASVLGWRFEQSEAGAFDMKTDITLEFRSN